MSYMPTLTAKKVLQSMKGCPAGTPALRIDLQRPHDRECLCSSHALP